MLKKQSWNNIPLPVRGMLTQIVDAIITQDLTMWERKSVNNERLWKLQHVASKLNKKIKLVKSDL